MQPPRNSYDSKLDAILRAASSIFAEKGYDRASIRDISAATGISLSGLYYYFKSKEDLLFLIQKHCFDTLLSRLDVDLEGVDDPVERLEGMVRNHLRFFVANMAEMKVLSHEADALTGEYRSEISSRKKKYVAAVQRCVDQIAPRLEPEDRRIATFALFGMMNWIYTWYRPGQDVPVEQLSANVLQIFLGGVAVPSAPQDLKENTFTDRNETSLWMER